MGLRVDQFAPVLRERRCRDIDPGGFGVDGELRRGRDGGLSWASIASFRASVMIRMLGNCISRCQGVK